MSSIFPSTLAPRQLVAFFDPANPQTYVQPRLNPSKIPRKPGSVRKYMKTINATSIISGGREYPPSEIGLSWNQLDKTDYEAISALTSVYPLVFIDNEDNGYIGALCVDSAEQIANLTKDVWTASFSFLVEGPFNGNLTAIPALDPPALSSSLTTPGGFIPGSTTIYVWSTVTTPWGESLPGEVATLTTSSANSWFEVTWTNPTSKWYRTTKLYWNTINNPSTATQLMETEPGQSGSFNIYGPYVPYSTANPPTYVRSFTGSWAGGLFVPSA